MILTWDKFNNWSMQVLCILAVLTLGLDLWALQTIAPLPGGFYNDWGRDMWVNELPYLVFLLLTVVFTYRRQYWVLLLMPPMALSYSAYGLLKYIIEYHSYISPLYTPLQLHAAACVVLLFIGTVTCITWLIERFYK